MIIVAVSKVNEGAAIPWDIIVYFLLFVGGAILLAHTISHWHEEDD